MSRTVNLIEMIADMENLYLAWRKTIRGKRDKGSVIEYRRNLDENLRELSLALLHGSMKWGPYSKFTIYDPKERVIKVAPLADRIAYHAICNVCEPIFEKYQIYDSYACRRGKGQFAALERAQKFSGKYPFYLKLDVRKYFDSIPHGVLFSRLEKLFSDPLLLKLFEGLLSSYSASPGRGIPIGILTSQFFANHYLAFLDHFVKEELRVRGYIRYMDDMLFFGKSSDEMKHIREQVGDFLHARLLLELKPEQLNRTKCGIPFLGLRVYRYSLRLSHRARYRFRRKVRKNILLYSDGNLTENKFCAKMETLFAFLQKTSSLDFRRRVLRENGFGS